jgi:hypothetical protein
MEAGLSYRRVAGGHAPHAPAYAGNVDDAGGYSHLGGRRGAGNDAGDANGNLWEASPRLPEKGGRSLVIPSVSVRCCANLVGVAGFEPATPSSRTKGFSPKSLILYKSNARNLRNISRIQPISVPLLIQLRGVLNDAANAIGATPVLATAGQGKQLGHPPRGQDDGYGLR